MKPEEVPADETSPEETKSEPVPKIPQTPEPPKEETKQEEQKPIEEIKQVEETKPEPEKPIPAETFVKEGQSSQQPQVDLSALREKANKARQDKMNQHLEEIQKLAKSRQFNNDDVRELLHVAQSTATKYLGILVKQGKLKKSGGSTSTSYSS